MLTVGAGSAGCVLANRLSEDSDKTVLLLEAGEEELEMHMAKIPASAFELQRSRFDWGFLTVPQRHSCKGLENQVQGSGELEDNIHNTLNLYTYHLIMNHLSNRICIS